jgi:acetyl esterase/lipase
LTVLISFSSSLLAEAPKVFDVWPDGAPDNWSSKAKEVSVRSGGVTRIAGVTKPILTFYAVKEKNRPVVLVCPGGGYRKLAYDKEGTELAEWFNKQNINAFVLKYRLPGKKDIRHIPPQQDAQRSISIIRSMAEKIGYDAKQIGMIGFSAGGHLTAVTSTADKRIYKESDKVDSYNCKPDFAMLIYPAYLTKKEQLVKELNVNSSTPPTFIMHAEDDRGHFPNSPVYAAALKKAGVSFEFFKCKNGGHGHGMRKTGKAADGWPDALAKWLKSTLK